MYTIVYVHKDGTRNKVRKYTDLEKAKKDIKKTIKYLTKYNEIEDRVSIDIEKELSIDGCTTIIESYKIKGDIKWAKKIEKILENIKNLKSC